MRWSSFSLIWTSSLFAAIVLVFAANVLGTTGGAVSWIGRGEPTNTPSSYVIGSSLAGAAFPREFILDETTPTQKSVRRWMPMISAAELEQQLGRALEDNPNQIFVELRPMTKPTIDGWLRLRVNSFFSDARYGLLSVATGLPVTDPTEKESAWLNGDYSKFEGHSDFQLENELQLEDATDLAAILDRAHDRNVEIIFLSFPRAASTPERHAGVSDWEVREAVAQRAAQLNRPLFMTDVVWPDEFFHDPIHLNKRGQARYLEELRFWLAQQ